MLASMRRFRPRRDYSRKLTRRITLADGTRLVTLKDAADLFTSARFAGVPTWPALEHAIELVIEAGDRGGRERIRAATDQIEFVLRRRRHKLRASISASAGDRSRAASSQPVNEVCQQGHGNEHQRGDNP